MTTIISASLSAQPAFAVDYIISNTGNSEVVLGTGDNLTVTSTGSIDTPAATADNILITGPAGTLINNGTIGGASPIGLYLGQPGAELTGGLQNTGAIVSTDVFGSAIQFAPNAVLGNINNSGNIVSPGAGIYAEDLAVLTGKITNTGIIQGSSGDGITLLHAASQPDVTIENGVGAFIQGYNGISISGPGYYDGFTITNAGTIFGSGANGAGIRWLAGGGLTLTNAGTISGGSDGAIHISSGDNTIILENGQQLFATGSKLIDLGSGGDIVVLKPGSLTFSGVVDAGGGINTLDFDTAGAPESFDVSLIGTQFLGFSQFVKTGNDTLTLTNSGTITDASHDWIVSDGALKVTTDTLQGNVSLDAMGRVVFSGTGVNKVDYAGIISGTGPVYIDNGVVIFDNPQSYTGGTVIVNGSYLNLAANDVLPTTGDVIIDSFSTLRFPGLDQHIGNLLHYGGGADGAIDMGGGSLTINQTTDSEYSGNIAGTGDLIKQGSGTLSLTGASSFFGSTEVQDGRLAVNGSLPNSIVTVEQTGVLGGNGTIAGIVAGLGGTVAPGNSIGTLHVSGDVNFAAGSTYQVEVNAAGQSDFLDVTGHGTIDPGSVVRVLAAPGSYAASTSYTILTSGVGVMGQFGGVTSNFAFLTPSLSYDPNNVYLILASNGIGFADVAKTRNQRAAATAAEALGSGNAVHDQIVGLDAAGAQAAFDSLSGEMHAAATGQLLRDARYVSDGVLGRLQQADRQSGDSAAQTLAALTPAEVTTAAGSAQRLALWGQAFGGWSAVDGNGNAGQLDRSLAGLLVGLDGQVAEDWRLGLAAGYSHSDLDLNSRNSTAGIDSYHLALYGGGHVGPVALRLGAAYSFNDIDSRRDVTVGSLQDHDKASYQGRTAQVFGEIGYDLQLGPVALEPFAGMAYAHLDTDGFQEKGGATALKGKSSDQDLPYSTLGLRAAGEVAKVAGGSLTAHGMVGWRHAYGDVTPTADLSFAGGAGSFTVAGTPIARDALVAQAGLDLAISERLTVGLAYDGQIAGNAQDNAVQGSLSWKF